MLLVFSEIRIFIQSLISTFSSEQYYSLQRYDHTHGDMKQRNFLAINPFERNKEYPQYLWALL